MTEASDGNAKEVQLKPRASTACLLDRSLSTEHTYWQISVNWEKSASCELGTPEPAN